MNLSSFFRRSSSLESRKLTGFYVENVVNTIAIIEKELSLNPAGASGLYLGEGNAAEVDRLSRLIVTKDVTKLPYVFFKGDLRSLAIGLKTSLELFEPIIPVSLFDHFLSPVARANQLLPRLPQLNLTLLEALTRHIYLISSMDEASRQYQEDLIEAFARITLRSHNALVNPDNDIVDVQTTAEALQKIIKAVVTGNVPETSSPKKNKSSDFSTTVSVIDRTVKVVYPKSNDYDEQEVSLLSNDDLIARLSSFGEVIDVGVKEKFVLVLYASLEGVKRCVQNEKEKIPSHYKIKYMGNKELLNNTVSLPVVPTTTAATTEAASPFSGAKAMISSPSQPQRPSTAPAASGSAPAISLVGSQAIQNQSRPATLATGDALSGEQSIDALANTGTQPHVTMAALNSNTEMILEQIRSSSLGGVPSEQMDGSNNIAQLLQQLLVASGGTISSLAATSGSNMDDSQRVALQSANDRCHLLEARCSAQQKEIAGLEAQVEQLQGRFQVEIMAEQMRCAQLETSNNKLIELVRSLEVTLAKKESQIQILQKFRDNFDRELETAKRNIKSDTMSIVLKQNEMLADLDKLKTIAENRACDLEQKVSDLQLLLNDTQKESIHWKSLVYDHTFEDSSATRNENNDPSSRRELMLHSAEYVSSRLSNESSRSQPQQRPMSTYASTSSTDLLSSSSISTAKKILDEEMQKYLLLERKWSGRPIDLPPSNSSSVLRNKTMPNSSGRRSTPSMPSASNTYNTANIHELLAYHKQLAAANSSRIIGLDR